MELFRLLGTIAIDNQAANKGLDETTDKGEKAQSKLSGAFSKIGSAAKVCGAAVATGMAAGAAAIVKIGKDAVASYADYEQLVGGVETLFKNSADTVQQYAQNAYKTAGMSANEYMETVTSFSASLLQSLDGDTAKAAESANLAITDMSDNANKMGTSMESIQTAYQGFAKQNYTMLDNLKLGYGGTKEEMERLLADASKLSGIKYDISSFDDMVQAIHVVQTEMGITGTTAKEAATTIQGSAASMKSAWQNLLTGMADENQNLDELLAQFMDSVVTFGDNLIPRIQNMLPRLVDAITKLATSLANKLPDIIETLLPSIIRGALSLVSALIQKFPSIVKSIVTGLANGFNAAKPEIKEIGLNLVKGLWNGIGDAKDWIIGKVKDFGSSILDGLRGIFQEHSPSKATEKSGKNLVLGIGNGISRNSKYAKSIVKKFGEELLSTLEQRLSNYKVYHDMSLQQEVDYWDNARKLFKKGTQDRIDADAKYYEAKKNLENQIITDAENNLAKEKRIRDVSAAEEASYWAKIVAQTKKGSDARTAAEEKYYSALESYQQQYESYVDNIMSQMKLFEEFVQGDAVDGSTLIANLQGQITGMESYYETMDSLNGKIGGTQLMSYLSTLGTDNLAELQAINSMTEEELQQYVDLYDQKYQMACDKATEALGTVETTTQETTKKSNTNVKNAMKSMLTNITKYSSSMVSTMQTKFSNINSTVSSNMSKAVAAVRSAVAEMNALLASSSATTGTTTTTTTSTKKTTVKKNAAGGILTKPTIFGYTPSTGQWQLGGEAGAEAIAPIDVLKSYVREAVAEANQNTDNDKIYNVLVKILYMLQNGKIIAVMDGEKMGEFVIQTVEREVYA